jgi:hypothetical protein
MCAFGKPAIPARFCENVEDYQSTLLSVTFALPNKEVHIIVDSVTNLVINLSDSIYSTDEVNSAGGRQGVREHESALEHAHQGIKKPFIVARDVTANPAARSQFWADVCSCASSAWREPPIPSKVVGWVSITPG